MPRGAWPPCHLKPLAQKLGFAVMFTTISTSSAVSKRKIMNSRLTRAATLLRDVARFEPDAAAPIEALEGAQSYLEDVVGRAAPAEAQWANRFSRFSPQRRVEMPSGCLGRSSTRRIADR